MPKSGGTFDGSVTFEKNIQCGTVYVANDLTIDTDEIWINSVYGIKRLDSYIKSVVEDTKVSK